jgi:hypothetical protein
MLVINGMKDTQVPVEDVFVLMRSGSLKDAWINPQGGQPVDPGKRHVSCFWKYLQDHNQMAT